MELELTFRERQRQLQWYVYQVTCKKNEHNQLYDDDEVARLGENAIEFDQEMSEVNYPLSTLSVVFYNTTRVGI
jgi:hypothetical protein